MKWLCRQQNVGIFWEFRSIQKIIAIRLCLEEERHIVTLGKVFNFEYLNWTFKHCRKIQKTRKNYKGERYGSDSQKAKKKPSESPLNRETRAIESGAAERKGNKCHTEIAERARFPFSKLQECTQSSASGNPPRWRRTVLTPHRSADQFAWSILQARFMKKWGSFEQV